MVRERRVNVEGYARPRPLSARGRGKTDRNHRLLSMFFVSLVVLSAIVCFDFSNESDAEIIQTIYPTANYIDVEVEPGKDKVVNISYPVSLKVTHKGGENQVATIEVVGRTENNWTVTINPPKIVEAFGDDMKIDARFTLMVIVPGTTPYRTNDMLFIKESIIVSPGVYNKTEEFSLQFFVNNVFNYSVSGGGYQESIRPGGTVDSELRVKYLGYGEANKSYTLKFALSAKNPDDDVVIEYPSEISINSTEKKIPIIIRTTEGTKPGEYTLIYSIWPSNMNEEDAIYYSSEYDRGLMSFTVEEKLDGEQSFDNQMMVFIFICVALLFIGVLIYSVEAKRRKKKNAK